MGEIHMWDILPVHHYLYVNIILLMIASYGHCFKYRLIYRPVFYPKRYDKYKNSPDIVLDRYWPIYRHVADISADI